MMPADNIELSPHALRRQTAWVVGVGASIAIALSTASIAMVVLQVRSGGAYMMASLLSGVVSSCIGPLLMLVVSPGVARGRGGAIAAAFVISITILLQAIAGSAWFVLEIRQLLDLRHLMLIAPRLLVAIVMSVFAVRLWLEERSLEPDAIRISAARAAWFRARVALVITWALLFVPAALSLALGAMFYLDDPKGLSGGIGIIFMIFGGVLAAIGIWLLILWIRLRRRGPIVARSTGWQVASMLFVWTILAALGARAGAPTTMAALFPMVMLAWILIELLHASLARNAELVRMAFPVTPLEAPIPYAQAVQPPPLPRAMFEPMEGREHI